MQDLTLSLSPLGFPSVACLSVSLSPPFSRSLLVLLISSPTKGSSVASPFPPVAACLFALNSPWLRPSQFFRLFFLFPLSLASEMADPLLPLSLLLSVIVEWHWPSPHHVTSATLPLQSLPTLWRSRRLDLPYPPLSLCATVAYLSLYKRPHMVPPSPLLCLLSCAEIS
jgi:hypothetical protein